MISWILRLVVCINVAFAHFSDSQDEFELLSSHEFMSNSDFFYDSDNEIDAVFSDFEETNLDYMLNDLKALDNIKKKVKSEVDKGTKWMAEHGDKVSGVLDRVSNVAYNVSVVAGMVNKVATVASVVPGLNVVATPIAAASFAVEKAAGGVKEISRAGRDVTMVATSFSKGYQDGGVKEGLKEGTKMVGNRVVDRAITKATYAVTGAITNKAAGVIGKGLTKVGTGNVKLSGVVGKASNALKSNKLVQKAKGKIVKKLNGKVGKSIKKGVNKVAKSKGVKSIKNKIGKVMKNKLPSIAKGIKNTATKIKGSRLGKAGSKMKSVAKKGLNTAKTLQRKKFKIKKSLKKKNSINSFKIQKKWIRKNKDTTKIKTIR
ncbi:hypothetical protein QTN25_002984 [Entamoeba marina]